VERIILNLNVLSPIKSILPGKKINRSARKARHERLFAKSTKATNGVAQKRMHMRKSSEIKFKLLASATALGLVLCGCHSLSTQAYMGESVDMMDAMVNTGTVVATDGLLAVTEGGFFAANSLATASGNDTAANGVINYVVQPEDTAKSIADNFGITVDTILAANNMYSAASVYTGKSIKILPTNGVLYQAISGETIENIARRYSIDAEAIVKQNNLASIEDAVDGKSLVLPGAKPLIANNRYIASNRSAQERGEVPQLMQTAGKLVWPTTGNISQYYRAGHYAIDIANREKPMIVASKSGTVITAADGWNGGYGNYVIIDHGDGMQTLYAHCDYVTVSVGDEVKAGDVLGRMGNTGRVYGATGIHVHFEVRVNGVKQNPLAYL